jgi:O-antigen/teichoic acid export membrane protein
MSDEKKKSIEYSKLLVSLITITYFIGLVIGGYVVVKSAEELSTYLAYIGGVVAITIPFYVWKAKSENVIKLKANYPETIAEKIIRPEEPELPQEMEMQLNDPVEGAEGGI